ncbi:hypothetical protein M5689_000819 [Euphorbia peplus]|nr:hypothetical protein M5689_000819 [Euphorbia peplus]
MEPPKLDYSSLVDTSRPFSSVKEAVAVFGERILVGEIYSPKPLYMGTPATPSAWSFCSPRNECVTEIEEENNVLGTLKKMEGELEETKKEVKMLKERERETEIAVASLNAELHKNMSKMAEAEAKQAAAAMARRRVSFRNQDDDDEEENNKKKITNAWRLSTAHTNGDKENKLAYIGRMKEKKQKKKKPVIPLVGDFFLLLRRNKKGIMSNQNNTSLNNPLYGFL